MHIAHAFAKARMAYMAYAKTGFMTMMLPNGWLMIKQTTTCNIMQQREFADGFLICGFTKKKSHARVER